MPKINNATGKYVLPFTKLEVKRIKTELDQKINRRNHLLFVMSINQGIRATDLLKIKIKSVAELQIGEKMTFKETKTGKQNFIFMNRATYGALHAHLSTLGNYDPDSYLFSSRKGNHPISLQQFGRLIKEWCRYAKVKNIKDYGVRSLRKTFGRLQFEASDNPRILALLKERFNHTSEAVTVRYLNITPADMEDIFLDI